MGVLRFQLCDHRVLTSEAAKRVYFSSSEGIPWRCHVEHLGGEIRVRRSEMESGLLHVPWDVPGRGPIMLTTANLRERPEPYDLALEVARGTLFHLKNQAALWELAGLELTADLCTQIDQAVAAFVRAIYLLDGADRFGAVQSALRITLDAMDLLIDLFVEQVLNTRRQEAKPPPAKWLACPLQTFRPTASQEREILATFNGAVVTPNWKEVESLEGYFRWDASEEAVQWCTARGLRLCLGPLVRNDATQLPNWLYLWQDDEESLSNYCTQYVQAAVKRFEGRVGLWNACAGFHAAGPLEITEETAVRLVAAMVSGIRQVDARTPVIVSFAHPFAEFMAREARELSPLHLADALLRADLGISGLGIELSFGNGPHQPLPRDWMQWNSHLDTWSQLGMPLIVMLSGPSPGTPASAGSEAYWSSQEQLLKRCLPLCLAKRSVHGVVWNQLSDTDPGPARHGLIDARGKNKPSYKWLQQFRAARLS